MIKNKLVFYFNWENSLKIYKYIGVYATNILSERASYDYLFKNKVKNKNLSWNIEVFKLGQVLRKQIIIF
jgi:hypothetical protein